MKSIFTLMLTISITACAWAQGNVDFTLQVFNLKQKRLSGLRVAAVERYTQDSVVAVTNTSGKVSMKLYGGKKWDVSVGKIRNCMEVNSFENSDLEASQMYIYDLDDYERKKRQVYDRDNSSFRQVVSTAYNLTPFGKKESMLRVKTKLPNGSPLKNVHVEVVCLEDSVVYTAKSDAEGFCYFIVPVNREYDIDINGMKNMRYVDFDQHSMRYTCNIRFVPTLVNERISNDTVYQDLRSSEVPTSRRAVVHLSVTGGPEGGANEMVYFRDYKSGTVYAAKTDENRSATLLLPLQAIYLIDFTYQSNVDALNLNKDSDFVTCNVEYYYTPDPRRQYPESFLPTPDRLFLQSFHSFLEKQYPASDDKLFELRITPVKKIHSGSREALYMLTLAGSDVKIPPRRIPLNIALVIDKSGSMYSNERLPSLTYTLRSLGESFNDGDQVAIVFFDTEANQIMSTDTQHTRHVERAISYYEPGGGTNIYRGMEIGTDVVQKNFDPDKTNRVFVLTDGYGTTPPYIITQYVEDKYRQGIEYSTVGLGRDYNQSLLELIARKGQGDALFVDSASHLSTRMLSSMEQSFSYSAKDLKVEIYYDTSMIFSHLYGFPAEQSGSQVNFKVPYVSAKTNQLAFLKFKLNEANKSIEQKPLTVKVSYWDMRLDKQVSYTEEVKLEWTEESDVEMMFDKEEKRLYAIAVINQSLKLMADANKMGDYQASKAALKDCKRQIKELFPDARPLHVQKLMKDVEEYLSLIRNIEDKGIQAY